MMGVVEEIGSAPAARSRRYSAVAIVLHWAIAALIVTNILIAWQFRPTQSLHQFNLFQLHKSVGITILLLSLIRLGWRLAYKPPPYPRALPNMERIGSSVVHWGFYVVMIGMPLTGWAMVSASPLNLPTLLYKTIPWPHIGFIHQLAAPQKQEVARASDAVHVTLSYFAYTLIVLHVAAALKHQIYDRDAIVARMLPFGSLLRIVRRRASTSDAHL